MPINTATRSLPEKLRVNEFVEQDTLLTSANAANAQSYPKVCLDFRAIPGKQKGQMATASGAVCSGNRVSLRWRSGGA